MKIWYQTHIVTDRMFSFIQKKKEIISVRPSTSTRYAHATTHVHFTRPIDSYYKDVYNIR